MLVKHIVRNIKIFCTEPCDSIHEVFWQLVFSMSSGFRVFLLYLAFPSFDSDIDQVFVVDYSGGTATDLHRLPFKSSCSRANAAENYTYRKFRLYKEI